MFIVVILVLLLVIGGCFVLGLTRLRRADRRSDEALSEIDMWLAHRADLGPNLVESVRGYAPHEISVFEEMAEARAQVSRAVAEGSVAEKSSADARLSQALFDVLAIVEAYPGLSASADFLPLERQLGESQHELSLARQRYNDAAVTQNSLVKTIPWMFFARFTSVGPRGLYEDPSAQIPPNIRF